MSRSIFVNLPVRDLPASTAFFEKLGFEKNPQFSDENASSIVFGENVFAMLLTHDYFATFSAKPIADARAETAATLALSADSREEVDRIADAALAQGVAEPKEAQDHGFMYGRSFNDLDGHHWEVVWMDPAALEQS
ncbi:VOC family protein [Schumannella soli]|uniref:Glyoxalase n=1 Tax=Schumannella soli TaxID=2590779 RepID=A0A506Y7L0_9MICO|nr:VOC family protein [Schumannella soli]TPW78015.1 glyoxalase [Schumannella soli]